MLFLYGWQATLVPRIGKQHSITQNPINVRTRLIIDQFFCINIYVNCQGAITLRPLETLCKLTYYDISSLHM